MSVESSPMAGCSRLRFAFGFRFALRLCLGSGWGFCSRLWPWSEKWNLNQNWIGVPFGWSGFQMGGSGKRAPLTGPVSSCY